MIERIQGIFTYHSPATAKPGIDESKDQFIDSVNRVLILLESDALPGEEFITEWHQSATTQGDFGRVFLTCIIKSFR